MALTEKEKETVILRLMCLKPFIEISSKHDIQKDIVFEKAEKAWEFATQTPKTDRESITGKVRESTRKRRGRPASKKS